jgi:hypothetical protein
MEAVARAEWIGSRPFRREGRREAQPGSIGLVVAASAGVTSTRRVTS